MPEMYDCWHAVSMEQFRQTGNFYHNVRMDRYASFLDRHGLIKQLLKEDAKGKR
jgi:hypothetical protein